MSDVMLHGPMRILSGIQPSGLLHLGNYYGAVRQFIALQEEGEGLYFLANLHSLTTVRDGPAHHEMIRDLAAQLIAFGLDPKRSILFRQSDIPEVTELYWILGTVVPLSNLERAHSYKDKLAHGKSPDFGLFAYPVLMAADILLYGADRVPVGKDQVQHIEFARDWATKFNVTYVKGYDPADPRGEKTGAPGVLRLPEARIQEEVATVVGLDGQKMSKSYGNAIEIFAEDAEIKKRIMSIKTDTTPVESPKPTDGALYQLLRLMAPKEAFAELDESWKKGGVGYGEYKKRLLGFFHDTFDAAREKRKALLADDDALEAILRDGAERARKVAAPVIAKVREAVGY